MAVAEISESWEEVAWRDVIAAFALDRLNEDRGHLVGRGGSSEESFFNLFHASPAIIRRRSRLRTFRIRHMMNVGHERREAAAVDQLRPGQRHGPVSASVKSAEKRDSS